MKRRSRLPLQISISRACVPNAERNAQNGNLNRKLSLKSTSLHFPHISSEAEQFIQSSLLEIACEMQTKNRLTFKKLDNAFLGIIAYASITF